MMVLLKNIARTVAVVAQVEKTQDLYFRGKFLPFGKITYAGLIIFTRDYIQFIVWINLNGLMVDIIRFLPT